MGNRGSLPFGQSLHLQKLDCSVLLCSIGLLTRPRKSILQLSGLRSQKAKGLKWKISSR